MSCDWLLQRLRADNKLLQQRINNLEKVSSFVLPALYVRKTIKRVEPSIENLALHGAPNCATGFSVIFSVSGTSHALCHFMLLLEQTDSARIIVKIYKR